MNLNSPLDVLRMLHAIDWQESDPFSHVRSRHLLMREYLRRAAISARSHGAENAWPFFDITEFIEPNIDIEDPNVAEQLDDLLQNKVGTLSVRRTCTGAVRCAALDGDVRATLLDMYEPLLIMYQRGGEYSVRELIDLHGAMIPQGSLDDNLAVQPFSIPSTSALDILDAGAEGRIDYYAIPDAGPSFDSSRGAVIRSQFLGLDKYLDEELQGLEWQPTDSLAARETTGGNALLDRITEIDAVNIIDESPEVRKRNHALNADQ